MDGQSVATLLLGLALLVEIVIYFMIVVSFWIRVRSRFPDFWISIGRPPIWTKVAWHRYGGGAFARFLATSGREDRRITILAIAAKWLPIAMALTVFSIVVVTSVI